jgi:hypothetical protein
MSERVNMKEIERGMYAFFTEDGLIDLAIGLVILGFGSLLFLDLPVFTGILGLAPLGLWYLGKRVITIPRVGIIRPGQVMERKMKGFFLSMLIVGAGVLPLFLLMKVGGQASASHTLVLFAMFLAVAISSLGLILRVTRFYFYAVFLFWAMSIGSVFSVHVAGTDLFVLSVIVAGIFIVLSGAVVLFRFLQKYPVVKSEIH